MCQRERADLNSKRDERATSQIIIIDKGDVPCRAEMLTGVGITGGYSGWGGGLHH